MLSTAMVNLCTSYGLHTAATCEEDFGLYTFGSIYTQIIRYSTTLTGLDGQYMCYYIFSTSGCTKPIVNPVFNATSLFPKPKAANATAPKASGNASRFSI